MTVIEFYTRLAELYPTSLSSSWDNDGLMCCPDLDAPVKRVLVALDATDAALSYAESEGFDLVLTHHPLIFKGLRALNGLDLVGRRVIKAMKAGISVISLHTRLDAGEGGVNDTLAALLGLSDIESFGDDDNPTLGRIGTTDLSDAGDFANRIKEATGVPTVTAYVSRPVCRVAVVGGGGGDLIGDARRAGADTIVTGESGYNKSLDAGEDGMNVFIAGHYYTEAPVMKILEDLAKSIAGAETELYTKAPELFF
ncbi:MAG: Nif3-like dinuclear metal center hexameric protein [Ruminococcaceae bacterium]|nr:Nif3-like dinuclear metal center hexameric protein [Oscillospiraceae bacterium]